MGEKVTLIYVEIHRRWQFYFLSNITGAMVTRVFSMGILSFDHAGVHQLSNPTAAFKSSADVKSNTVTTWIQLTLDSGDRWAQF